LNADAMSLTADGEVLASLPASPRGGVARESWLGSPSSVWVTRLSLVAFLLASWELTSGRWIRTAWFSKPSAIADSLWRWAVTGVLWLHLSITLEEMALGFVIGAVLGVTVGLLLGQSLFVAQVFDPFIVGLNSLPKMALAPLLILWFGIGIQMKIVYAGLVVFLLVFFNTYAGVRDVDSDLIDIVRTMGAKRRHILVKVALPSALVWVFTGLRISVAYALVGAVIGEILASNRGIGYLIQQSASQFDTSGTFAALFVLLAVAGCLNWLLGALEKRTLRWKRSG
jgi:NitT/TauT family transport system permease protein